LDIKREPPKKTKKYIGIGIGLVGIVAVSVGISKLKPAAPPVERGTLWIDTVKRGSIPRDVNAPGTLMPEHIQIVTALTSGRVESLPVQPGVNVTPSTVLVTLANPDVQLALLQDQQQLDAAYSNLASLKTTLQQGILTQQGAVAQIKTQYNAAVRTAAMDDSLAKLKLVAANDVAGAHDQINEMKTRLDIEQKRLVEMQSAEQQQLDLQQQQIESLKRILADQQNRVESMRVTAPEAGQLQTLGNPQLELGQYVTAGQELARIVQPGQLKAELRVPENLAKDVRPGLPATIDLHTNTIVKGHVTRTDPSSIQGTVTVDVAIDDPLPPGTRSDLAVDGTIELERLNNVMYIGRPGFGQPDASVGIFKIDPNKGEAHMVTVQLGRASVTYIEVKSGLSVGDSVIISDMSQFDNTPRVRIK